MLAVADIVSNEVESLNEKLEAITENRECS